MHRDILGKEFGIRYKSITTAIILAALGALMFGCVEVVKPVGGKRVAMASCDECHPFPGSAMCREQTMTINGSDRTTCNDCHASSVVQNTVIAGLNKYALDSMGQGENGMFPVTGAGHANGTVDLDYNQCVRCHSYPPLSKASVTDSTGHMFHVGRYNMNCLDCHFQSIQHDSYYVYVQLNKVTPRGDSIPLVNPAKHRNKTVDVVLRPREQIPNAALNVWDPVEKSCSNVTCHKFPSNHYKKSYWERKGK